MKPPDLVVYKFPNGLLMVFDRDGKQMPEYQGKPSLWKWIKLYKKLKEPQK